MRIVMKFGGGILDSREDLKKVAEITRQAKGERLVVVSALKGITDRLIEMASQALASDREITNSVNWVRQRHESLLEGLKAAEAREKAEKRIEKHLKVLERTLFGVSYLGEMTPRAYDMIQTTGERLSVVVVAAFLNDAGIKARAMNAEEMGLLTDSDYNKATPLLPKVEKNFGERVVPLLKKEVVVATGFYGVDINRNIVAFGRGGSDFSAGIMANAIGAERVELWKDVNGFMSADPKVVENARLLESLSYEEAEELGYFGAKILYPRTIAPLRAKRIKAVVKNVEKPEKEGTVIGSALVCHPDRPVKSIATRTEIAMVNIRSAEIAGTPGAAAEIFSALSNRNVNIDLISTSETGISLTINEADLENARLAVNDIDLDLEKVSFEKEVALIGVIGECLRGTPGIAGRLFTALGNAGINIEAISQGSSELNISFVVKEKDLEKAVKAAHKEFLE